MTFVRLYFCVFFPRILAVIPWTRVDGRVCSNRAAKLLSIRQIFDCAAARLDEAGISAHSDHSVVYRSSSDAPWEVPKDVALNKQVANTIYMYIQLAKSERRLYFDFYLFSER